MQILFLFNLLKRVGFALFLVGVCLSARAQWPVELRWSGVSLGYPKIGADGSNGAFVAGSGLAFDGWDTFLFHVDSAGNSLWEVSDSACYIAPGHQYPIALYPDGTGGCVALIDEEVLNFPDPSRNRVQIIRFDAEGHKVWQYMPYDTTWEMLHFLGALAVTEDQVVVVWSSGVTDSIGSWYTRLNVDDGSFIDDPSVNYLTRRSIRSYFTVNDSLYFKTLDSLYALCLQTNEVVPLRSTVSLQVSQMVQIGDSILIVGNTGNLYLVQCLYGNLVSQIDTLSQELISLSSIVPCSSGAMIAYSRNEGQVNRLDLFGRLYLPSTGLGEEFVICDEPDYQSDLRAVQGSQGVGLAWSDLREAAYVYVQQYQYGQWRWPSGYRLAPIEVSPNAQMDACGGGEFGYVLYGDLGSVFYVQPIDSLPIDTVPNSLSTLPSQFILHDPYPNPFNSEVQIQFELAAPQQISVTVYNLLGEIVAQLTDEVYSSGTHQLHWQSDEASGIYLLSLKTSHETRTRKMLLIR